VIITALALLALVVIVTVIVSAAVISARRKRSAIHDVSFTAHISVSLSLSHSLSLQHHMPGLLSITSDFLTATIRADASILKVPAHHARAAW